MTLCVLLSVTIALTCLSLSGMSLFMRGFFPDTQAPPRASASFPALFRARDEPLASAHGAEPVPRFGRLVVMVVDALRASYVFGNGTQLHYVRHLIDSGQALAYVAHAHAPTVTLPRIKALMAGTVPNFMDLLRNFDSAQVADDNFVDRLRAAGRRLVFYGDDTWQKLFPGRFEREEGTTSFFVQDTVEVDANVTRNVLLELQRDDWDAMILHYLGLDHIGHWQGPSSPLMGPKQREMDAVVRTILRSLAAADRTAAQRNARQRLPPPKPSLLLICSDHGMTDQGGHGGTSLPESSTVAIFAAASSAALVDEGDVPSHWPRQHEDASPPRVQQTDIAPTLSLLFGVPIPTGSIGVVLSDVLLGAPLLGQPTHALVANRSAPFVVESTPQRMQHLLRGYQINAAQYEHALRSERTLWSAAESAPATDTVRRLWHTLDAARASHRRWLLIDANSERARFAALGNQTRELYEQFLRGVQGEFIQLLTRSDLTLLIAGAAVLIIVGLALASLCAALVGGSTELDVRLAAFASGAALLATLAGLYTYCAAAAADAPCGICVWREYGAALGTAALAVALAVGVLLSSAPTAAALASRQWSLVGAFAVGGSLLHWLSLSGTSLVEEEHETWYFLTATLVLLRAAELVAQRDAAWRFAVPLLACMRVARVWNQTGTAWNSKTATGSGIVPRNDVGEWLAQHLAEQEALFAVHCAAVIYAVAVLWRRRSASSTLALLAAALLSTAVGCVYVFKWRSSWLADVCRDKTIAKAAYASIAAGLCAAAAQARRSSKVLQERLRDLFAFALLALVTLASLLQRGPNGPLLSLFAVQGLLLHRLIQQRGAAAWVRALAFEWFGVAAMFQLGNSNSTATIEISGAYTGFDEFYQPLIGAFVWLIVYTGPLMFVLMLCASVLDHASPASTPFATAALLTSGRAALTAGLFSVYCIALRHHLFVWSVMSPKYLYVVGSATVTTAQVLLNCVLARATQTTKEKQ
jgi:ethanolaminephosphotransferase